MEAGLPAKRYFDQFLGLTFGQLLDRLAQERPDQELLVYRDQRTTYGEFYQQVLQMAAALRRLGIRKGDRVAALFPNRPEFFILQQACLYMGAVFVLLSTRYREFELSYMLKHSGARCLFIIGEYMNTNFIELIGEIKPELPELELVFVLGSDGPDWCRSYETLVKSDRAGNFNGLRDELPAYEDIASILYTSGSTGLPKGVMMSHRAFIFNSTQVSQRLRINPDDVSLMMVPCSHTLCAFIQFTNALMAGCRIVIMETFEPGEALRLYEKERVSLIYGVPTMFHLMIDHPDFTNCDFKSSRAGYMGGAFCPKELVQAVRTKMNCRISCTYGMSENGCCTISDLDDDETVKSETVGRPTAGIEIKLMNHERKEVPLGEVGEIVVRGENLFTGYYKQPDLTKASFDPEGFFYTGDLGKFLKNGYLTIVGRKKEMIIRGGFNVYPVEVEEQIRLIEEVQSVAVIGIPDPVMGEKIIACIVPVPGKEVGPEEVIAFCKKRLANYKVPNAVVIMNAFPTTTIGKIQKFKLQAELTEKFDK